MGALVTALTIMSSTICVGTRSPLSKKPLEILPITVPRSISSLISVPVERLVISFSCFSEISLASVVFPHPGTPMSKMSFFGLFIPLFIFNKL